METASYKKKDIIGGKEHNERYTIFVDRGLVRTYMVRGKKNHTIFFSFEGDLLGPFPGLIPAEIPELYCEALEDTIVYRAPRTVMEELFSSSLELSCWARKMLEGKIREYNFFFTDYFYEEKTTQYKKFLVDYPELIRRVPLKDIAGYLNVTPQSLSRIRAKGWRF
ncbi:Crp/Fnr family transcriptional regulator [Pedobacter suwonensis]